MRTAASLAAARAPEGTDFCDTRQRYLLIRQRGPAATWLIKTRGKTRVLGSAIEGRSGKSNYLALKAARDKAAQIYASIAAGDKDAPPRPAPAFKAETWTWADLDREYQTMMAMPRWLNRKMKAPSQGTCDDIRLTFRKPAMTALHPKLLTDLDRPALKAAIAEIEHHRPKEKAVAYFKAAMSWAADKHPDESGLLFDFQWWDRLKAPDPSEQEASEIATRQVALIEAKKELSVDHLAEVLLRHENYCVGRTGGEKITPGIRWGLWWVSHTANRRFSTVKFERSNFTVSDEFGPRGWGRAMWPPAMMKARLGFWLPLPPETSHIASSAIADWRQLVNDEHGASHPDSRWVFASTVRMRDDDDKDRSVYPNSLNRHLQRMKKGGYLNDLPVFGLHLIRTVAGNFLSGVNGLPGVASSLMLAHKIPADTKDEAAPTTKEFYLTSQRMDLKADAMLAWTDALMNSYAKRGGKFPMPNETGRARKKA